MFSFVSRAPTEAYGAIFFDALRKQHCAGAGHQVSLTSRRHLLRINLRMVFPTFLCWLAYLRTVEPILDLSLALRASESCRSRFRCLTAAQELEHTVIIGLVEKGMPSAGSVHAPAPSRNTKTWMDEDAVQELKRSGWSLEFCMIESEADAYP